ncbi:MAG: peptidyl-prolyl cis-trans isomerase [Planctomycetaceae bacterium]|nr:peptidyl-prolyl cis-trans isomerase [Planctomycetaceae bacterium]
MFVFYDTLISKKRSICTPIFVAICLLTGCGKSDQSGTGVPKPPAQPVAAKLPAGILARSGDLSVSADQFRTAIKAVYWKDRATTPPTLADAEDSVTRLLVGQALQREADRQGAQNDPGYRAAMRLTMAGQLAALANMGMQFDMYAPDPPAQTQNELYEYYKHFGYVPQVRFNYIFLRTAGLSDQQKAAKRELAEKIRQRVTTGKEDFHKVLMEVSEAQNKNPDNYVIGADADNLDPKLWDKLASMKPLSVSEVLETPAGYQILYLDRSTVMRPEANFAGWDLGEVDRFFFTQMFKQPINKLFLEYKVKTPVYLKSPSDPMPPADAVLIEVGSERLTLAELAAAREFAERPALNQAALMSEVQLVTNVFRQNPGQMSMNALATLTLAERARRLGIADIAAGSIAAMNARAAVNQAFLAKKAAAGQATPSADQLKKYYDQWKEIYGRVPVVAGWTVRIKPAAGAKPSVVEAGDEIARLRKQIQAGEAIDKLAASYSSKLFKLEVKPQQPAMLDLLRSQNPAWPEEPLTGKQPVVSIPSMQPDGYALYVIAQRRAGTDWKFEDLQPMLKDLWQREQAQMSLLNIEKAVRDKLEFDRDQLKALIGEKKQLVDSLPPEPKKL